MTPRSAAPPVVTRRPNEDESIGDWILLNKNALSWGLLALAVIVAGGWFYKRSQGLREERADTAYYQARREALAGNAQLAQSDLKKMVDRYTGTRGGTQARMYLAELLFDQNKFKDGIVELKAAEKSIGSKDDFSASVHLLEANGYEESGDFTNAADQYRLAAETTRFPNDKNQYKAYEARALMAAGKRAEAIAIWQDLAKDPASPFSLEAKMRLGELEATPAKV
jgi:predicted negative regulator of RcsB-dependent stress response